VWEDGGGDPAPYPIHEALVFIFCTGSVVGKFHNPIVLFIWALGDMYLQTKEDKKAVQAFKKVIKLCPKSQDAYQRLALILTEQPKHLNEASNLALKAEELAPKSPFSLDALGVWVYVQKGRD
jgi:tetratricopeptide (TPR) repeat protein